MSLAKQDEPVFVESPASVRRRADGVRPSPAAPPPVSSESAARALPPFRIVKNPAVPAGRVEYHVLLPGRSEPEWTVGGDATYDSPGLAAMIVAYLNEQRRRGHERPAVSPQRFPTLRAI